MHAYKFFGCQLNEDSKAVNSLLFSCPQTFDCSRQEKHPNNINIQGWKVYNWDPERLEQGAPYLRPWSDALTTRPSQHKVYTLNLNH